MHVPLILPSTLHPVTTPAVRLTSVKRTETTATPAMVPTISAAPCHPVVMETPFHACDGLFIRYYITVRHQLQLHSRGLCCIAVYWCVMATWPLDIHALSIYACACANVWIKVYNYCMHVQLWVLGLHAGSWSSHASAVLSRVWPTTMARRTYVGQASGTAHAPHVACGLHESPVYTVMC